MNDPRATLPEDAAMILQSAVPILSVADLGAALEFYERVLGFDIEWKWGEPPHLASICRDRVELNLSQLGPDTAPAISKVYFQMAGVDAYYLRVKTAGANVAVALADRPYGMRDFRVLDPSGNELSFGEALHQAKLD
jgi:uncharacterized glyoxalase superfamily protein PhnB